MNGIRPFVGIGLLLISGLTFSVCILMAMMALKNGIDLNTSNVARYFVAAMMLFIYHKINKQSVITPKKELFTALALGITVFMMGIGYLGATRYIPVSLAVLIFYTGPFSFLSLQDSRKKNPLP